MLFRIIGVASVFAIVIFCAKDTTFRLLLAPCDNGFMTYRWIENIAQKLGVEFRFAPFHVQLINTELSSQFMTHVSTSVYLALLFASPYVVVEFYRFIPNRSLEIFSYKKSDCSRLYHRYSICILTQYASFVLF